MSRQYTSESKIKKNSLTSIYKQSFYIFFSSFFYYTLLTTILSSLPNAQIQFFIKFMNPYQNYNFQPPGQNFNWYSLLQSNPNFYSYYHAPPFNYPPRPYNSAQEGQSQRYGTHEVIKIEEDSDNQRKNNQNENKKKALKSKKFLPKIGEVDKNIYQHPKKHVHHRVKYFDPSASPVVTTAEYNLVQSKDRETERQKAITSFLDFSNLNQLKFPQVKPNQFIVFRFRRIKKKFKKYIKPKQEGFTVSKEEESDSDASEQESQSYESESDNEQRAKSQLEAIKEKNLQGKQNRANQKLFKTSDSNEAEKEC